MISAPSMRNVVNYATSTTYCTPPTAAQMQSGVIPLDSLPADWWNYLWCDTRSAEKEAYADLTSVVGELNTVLCCGGVTPNNECINQLATAIINMKREPGTTSYPGAVKSSTTAGYISINASTGYATVNCLGDPSTLTTTSKVVVGAINEVKTTANSALTCACDSAKLGGTALSGLFTAFSYASNKITATVGGVTKCVTLGTAAACPSTTWLGATAKACCAATADKADTVKVTQKAIGSLSAGCPLLFGSTDSGNASVYGSCCAIRLLSDATSTRVMVGISDKVGALGLYTTGGSYAMLKAASSTACHEITLPAKTGTVALTCDLGTAAACPSTTWLGATAKACCSANADKADTVRMVKFTADADRPILISCPVSTWSGSCGYPDNSTQGISTSCPLTFNPATGVLKAKTFCGALSGNASSATYAGCIRVTETKCNTSFPLLFTAGNAAGTNYIPRTFYNGIRYNGYVDATTAVASELIIGNSIACGTSGNRYGFITLYGYGAYYTVICAPSSTAARAACFPDKSGTLAMTSDITLAQATCLSAFACSTTATPPTTNPTAGKIFGYARSYTNCAATTQTTSYDRRTCWCMNVIQACNACSGSVNLYVCSYQCCYSGTAGVETCSVKRFAFCSDGSFCAPNKIYAPALCSCSTTFGSLSVKRNCSNLPAGIAFCNCEGLLGYLSSSTTANGQFRRYKTDGSTQYTILDTSAAVTIAQGGTGATTAAAARGNLGAMAALCANGYYGMATPAGCADVWIRTTSLGIIPDKAATAANATVSIGTSTWYFKAMYAKTFNGDLSGTATNSTCVGGTTKANLLSAFTYASNKLTVTVGGTSKEVTLGTAAACAATAFLGATACAADSAKVGGTTKANLLSAFTYASNKLTVTVGGTSKDVTLGTAAACAATCFVPNLPFAVSGHYLGTCTTTGNKLIPLDSLPSGDTYATGYCITCYNVCEVEACSPSGGVCYCGCVCLKNNTSTRIRYLVEGYCCTSNCCQYYCCFGYLQPGCCTGPLPGYFKYQASMSPTCVNCPAIIKWYSSSSSSIKMSTNPKGLGFIYDTGGGPVESEIFFNE